VVLPHLRSVRTLNYLEKNTIFSSKILTEIFIIIINFVFFFFFCFFLLLLLLLFFFFFFRLT
jgi:hypothetical protein